MSTHGAELAHEEVYPDVVRHWRELLGAEPSAAGEDFFRAGGDSIRAAGLVARLASERGVELALRDFVAEPTPAGLTKQIAAARTPLREIPRKSGPARCSFAQERFWFIDETSRAEAVGNVAWAMRIDGVVDNVALEHALGDLVARHEALRTRFVAEDGQPQQVVEATVEPALELLDCSSEEDPEAAARDILAERAHEPFDLTKPPLLRAQLVRLQERANVLQFVAHHIVCDDWSKGVIHRDLSAFYAARSRGESAELSGPSAQYPAYAEWQRERFDGAVADAELRHWQERLAGAPPALKLPTDRPRPPAQSNRGARLRTTLPADVVRTLRSLGRDEGATFYVTMLTAFEAFLHRYTRADDLVVGTAIDNRGRLELEDSVGLYTNVLALRTDASGSPSFRELVSRVREATLDAIAHQELPFDQLVAVAAERDPSRHPIFQVFYEFIVPAPVELPIDGIHVRPFDVPKRTAEFDLGLYLDEGRGELDAVWEYNTDLFEQETIDRLARHYVALLRAIAAAPDRPIDELSLLDEEEQNELLADSQGPAAYVAPGRIEDLFAAQARRTPDLTAVSANGEDVTYAELDARANQLGNRLRELGVEPGKAVALCVDRSVDLVVAVLGILKAGAAYVPLNPDHPSARLRQQLEDARAQVVVTEQKFAEKLEAFDRVLLCIDSERAQLADQPAGDPPSHGTQDDPVYILYTSGSTGAPKGVVVRHRNLANYTAHMLRRFGGDGSVEGWAFAAVSAISTDLGNTTIFPSLLGGGCLHLVSETTATDGEAFADFVRAHRIDVLKITPSHLRTLLDAAGDRPILPAKWLVLGGEALAWDLVERISGPRILNHYGPTEATIGCCTYEVDRRLPRPPSATVPIGRPISNTVAYVLDRHLAPLPTGVPGELYVGGAGIAAGYLARPEETAERFVSDPFSSDEDATLYRTGDLVRRLPDGTLEFLGRADEQVKVRGFRVEPAEIEAVLERCAGIRRAVVVPIGDGDDLRLFAFVVGETGVDAIREELEATLPPYMVPSRVVFVEAFPLTPNGKLDRRALLALATGKDVLEPPAAAPAGALETELLAIWSELLGRDGFGVNDNFFEVGGHSLLAIRLLARLKTDFDLKLTLKQLIGEPTVAALAARVAESRGEATDATPAEPQHEETPPIGTADRSRPIRCSFAQEQLWLVDELALDSAAYNFSWPMRLRGPLDVSALQAASVEVVRRHEALRTRFVVEDGQPMQVVDDAPESVLHVVDVSSGADPEVAAREIVDATTAAHLDLRKEPPFQLKLLRLSEQEHVLHILVHHIVFDGVSKVVLYRDLAALYSAYATGAEASLPTLTVQYADYADWQREWLQGGRLEAALAHWSAQLEGIPKALDLPTDHPRPPIASTRGARHRVALPQELRDALEELARTEGSTLFMVMLAALDVLLSRYTGEEDVVVGAPVDTRDRSELEEVIGPFLNTIVLRNDLSGDPSFRELLARVRERTLDAVAHHNVPFERLVEALQPERDLSRHPIFQVLLALNPREISLDLAGIDVEDIEPRWSSARVDLFLVLDDLPRGLETVWEYSTDLFEPDTVERMSRHFIRLLHEIVDDPGRKISELRLLREGERATVIAPERATDIPEARLEQLISAQAASTPDRVAVEFEGTTLSYAELDARANRLAHYLLGLGVEPEEPVGVSLRRSADLVVALLGVLKAGAAYVPVDPSFPADRRSFMLEDSGARVVVTEDALVADIPSVDHVVSLDGDATEIDAGPATEPSPEAAADGLAYIIYTSGSTGTPKGVEVGHRALVNFLTSMRREPGLDADDVLVAVTTLSFDIAGLELYLPLVTGARVVVAPEDTAADARKLWKLLDDCGATVMQATPATWRMLVDVGWPGRPGLKALCGGEALPPSLARELVERGLDLWNMYGPTETTIWSTVARVTDADAPITLGRPIANTTVVVLDAQGEPSPTGVPGELCIGGTGVARGYRGRPELTDERFIRDPFTEREGARLYRTGDLARMRADGSIQFLGRRDQQVKVRGFRIELEEIESHLLVHPHVNAAVVSTHRDDTGENTLVAYVVPAGEQPTAAELRQFLSARVPAYMVPSAIMTLAELPLTPNGKIDRKALPAPIAQTETAHVAPRSEKERRVAALFGDVLGRDDVGIDDNFFELGGHSLLATRLVARLSSDLATELPLRTIFEQPTVRGLAALLESHEPETAEEPPPIVATTRSRRASFAQERFWFVEQFAGAAGAGAYNISWPLRIRGPLDVVALKRALAEIVRRHEALRTRFGLDDEGRPLQIVDGSRELVVEHVDLRNDPTPETTAKRLVDEETTAPFDLERGPLLRARLIELGDDDHILHVVVHHIVADGWSKGIVFDELSALYAAFSSGRGAPVPALTLQYGDYAEWQRSWLRGERLERELSHWLAELEGMPAALELPADHPRPPVSSLRGAWERSTFSPPIVDELTRLTRTEGATFFMAMLAAYDILLARYSGQTDIVVGAPVDCRTRPELERVVGPFVNTLVLRNDLSDAPTFRELLARVRESTLKAMSHQELPFEQLVEALQPERDLARHPVFQVLLSLNPTETPLDLEGLDVEELRTEKSAARTDLTLILEPRPEGLEAIWEHSTDLFERETVARMSRHFARLVEEIVAHPDEQIGSLRLTDENERNHLLDEGNDAGARFPVACLHELFEAQAQRSPESPAATYEGRTLSYAELNSRANRLAHRLRSLGVGSETRVGLFVERSLDLVVAIVGILKAGGAYVPLDPDYPSDRVTFMLDDTKAPVIVTQTGLVERLPESDAKVVCLDRDAELDSESAENPSPLARPENLAYIIYTSGSTGRPKGVEVEHRQVARLFSATEPWFAFGQSDVWTLLHSYAFDFSVWELWGALLHGGRVVVVPHWTIRSPEALAQLVADEGVTVLNATPSLFSTAMERLLEHEGRLALRLVIFGGEALRPASLSRWFQQLGDRGPQLVNMYGITETTVHVTYRPLSARDAELDSSPIGRPIPDLQLYVLDEHLEPVPVGVPGELYVGGAGVARGYLNRPELTAERFLQNPFGTGRLYRTGDRVRRLSDGSLEFHGRIDDQVKVRGYRIELGEIEATLAEHEAVAEVVVVPREGAPGDTRLAAYVTPDEARAGVVRRLLRLENEGRLSAERSRELPNGMTIAHLSQSETDYLYDDIFVKESYLQHGVALSPSACVFDVGANIGLFSLLVHRKSPGARIFAFEPMPPVFEQLELNAELYGLDAVLLDCGVGATESAASFTFMPHNTLASGRFVDVEEERAASLGRLGANGANGNDGVADELIAERLTTEVLVRPVRTLSSVIVEHDVERIDLLKIDAEKSEPDILQGIAADDWPKIQQVVIEVHGESAEVDRIVETLEARGFAVAAEGAIVYARRGTVVSATATQAGWQSAAALRNDLRAHLKRRLPEYMVPSITLIEELPITVNGKLDRKRLPLPELDTAAAPSDAAGAPRTETEEMLSDLWRDLLGIEDIRTDADFFELGGHSLLVAQLAVRIRERFGLGVSVHAIFEEPTIEALARRIDATLDDPLARLAADSSLTRTTGIQPRAAGEAVPLSASQEQLWLIDQWDPGAPTYNVALPFRLKGTLDVAALRTALSEILRRHEAFRTRFRLSGDVPVAVVEQDVELDLPVIDLRAVPAEQRDAAALDLVAERAARPFDFSRDLLLRATVVRLDEDDHILLLETHHIVFDGWSEGVLLDELAPLYEGRELPEPPLQFGDFALWQHQHLRGDVLESELRFWRRHLAGAPTSIELPTDHPRPEGRRFRGATHDVEFPREVAQAIRSLSSEERVTPYIVLLAALATLLYRTTGQDDVLIGSPFANRPGRELERVIGFFSNTLVFRARLTGNPTFRELLRRVRELAIDVYAHHEVAFEKIVAALRPQREAGVNPLFQVNFRVRTTARPTLRLPGLVSEPLQVDVGLTRFDFALDLAASDENVSGYFRYNADIFEPTTIARIADDFAALLGDALADPDRRLLSLALASDGASDGPAPAAPARGGIRDRVRTVT